MANPFIEDYRGKKTTPATESVKDFDESELPTDELRQMVRSETVKTVAGILEWLLAGDLRSKRALKRIGMRAVAMAWVIAQERFKDASLHTVAKTLGCTASNISPLTAEFSLKYGIRNEHQNHDWRKH